MKKIIAILCAAVMTVATCVTPFAAISGKEVAKLESTVTVDLANTDPEVVEAIQKKAEQGIFVVCVPVELSDTSGIEKDVAEVLASKDGSTDKVLKAAKLSGDLFKTPGGKELKRAALAVAAGLYRLQFSDGEPLPNGKIAATLILPEAMKGKDAATMQIDTEKNEAGFVDTEVKGNNFTVSFTSNGPFVPFSVGK